MKPLIGRLVCSWLLLVQTALGQAEGAGEFTPERAEPEVTCGALAGFPLPKTILFSVGPDEIIANAQEWQRHGVNAFFLDFVARNWSSDVWAADGEPWTIGASDKTFQKTKQATAVARRLGSEVFLKVAFDHPFEWFNDTAWIQIGNHFRQFAIFARDSGCQGIAIDIEYIGEQYDYGWSGYDYRGYTRADLLKKVQERMTGVAQVLYHEFPAMVLLTFPECGLSLGTAIQVAWIEEAARRQAPGGVHYCTESTYRNPNVRYMLGHAALCNELFHRLLSPRGGDTGRSVAASLRAYGRWASITRIPTTPACPWKSFARASRARSWSRAAITGFTVTIPASNCLAASWKCTPTGLIFTPTCR